MITDGSGNVVYSASYSPFGKLHKVWLNTYDPSLKFSGKEREATSGDDYFGARYFSGDNYRFLSFDPVINRTEALANPKLWNLYSYCRNNPITFSDPDGRDEWIQIGFNLMRSGRAAGGYQGTKDAWSGFWSGYRHGTHTALAAYATGIGSYYLGANIPAAIASGAKGFGLIKGIQTILRYLRTNSKIKDIHVSLHAAQRMVLRNVSPNQLNSVLKIKPFRYFHNGMWKLGHYDPASKIFVGRVKNVITTVITNASIKYIEKLQK